jgi:hypothetical protein
LLWLGGAPILAHNLLLLAGYVASGLATYVLLLSMTKHRGAALVATVVFALYPDRAEGYAKVQLQLIFWTPFALWTIHRLRADPGSGSRPRRRVRRADDRSIAYLRERRVDLLLVHTAYYINGNFSEDVNRLRRRSDIDWVGEFPAPNGQVTDVFRIRPSSAGG